MFKQIKSLIILLGMVSCLSVLAQGTERPKVQELDFFIGNWEITFDWYDTHKPERGVIFTEKGNQQCRYEMELNETPMYIICEGQLVSSTGRVRTIHEAISYNRFINAFERIGMYSNWPSHGVEKLLYHPDKRMFELRGELDVQDHVLERYEDFYYFNEDYTSFTRKQVGNFSDMPVSEFNLTATGTGKKVGSGE